MSTFTNQSSSAAPTTNEWLLYCYYTNIRSIVNKLFPFQAMIYSHNYDIVAITETWLFNSIFDNKILPTNYRIYRNDRSSRGGGVLLAVQDTIISKTLSSPANIEMLTIEAEISQTIIFLCVVYLPPNPTLSQIQSLTSHLSQLPQSWSTVLIGDFNLPDINWDTLCRNSTVSDTFCGLFWI